MKRDGQGEGRMMSKTQNLGRTKRHSNGLEAGKKKNGSRLEDVLEFQPGGAWKQGLCRGSRVKCGHRGAPSAGLPGSLEKGEVWTQRQTHAEGRQCGDTQGGKALRGGRVGGAHPQAEGRQSEEVARQPPLQASEGARPCRPLDFELLVSRTARK